MLLKYKVSRDDYLLCSLFNIFLRITIFLFQAYCNNYLMRHIERHSWSLPFIAEPVLSGVALHMTLFSYTFIPKSVLPEVVNACAIIHLNVNAF